MIICSMEATIKKQPEGQPQPQLQHQRAAPGWQRELRLAANKRYETKRNETKRCAKSCSCTLNGSGDVAPLSAVGGLVSPSLWMG